MDTVPLPTPVIRIDLRHRHQAYDVEKKETVQVHHDQDDSLHAAHEALLIREHEGRAVMGKAHRLFHRRSAQTSNNVKTVNVEVIATVDTAGNIVGKATSTPAESSAEPTSVIPAAVLPSVPSVPPFPTDLVVPSVPSYPWPSGVPTVVAVDTTSQTAAPASTPAATLSSTFPSLSGYNSTTSRTISSSASSSLRLTSSSKSTSSQSSSHSSTLSSTSSATSTQILSQTWIASSTEGAGAGGFVDPATATVLPSATSAATTDTGSSAPLETPQVVGTVVGSLAGFALVLWLFLFLIKRHKQKQRGGALQLTGDDHTDREISQPMAQNAARTSFVPPSFLNRFSGASRSTADTASTGEKSFQRISGRKLPSAFSEGMTSEQFAAGRGDATLSGSSFYADEKGWYGGSGVISKDFGDPSFAKEIGEMSSTGAMGTTARVRPSPAQTPVIHHAADDDAPVWGAPPRNGGDTLSPPHTPNPDFPPRGTLGRSHPSRDGSTISRSSRFTENV